MTAGALIQILSSGGDQDMYLSINPQMTYFKSVYRRYTNFAIETIPIEFISAPDFGKQCRVEISRYGDLVSDMLLHIKIDSLNNEYQKAINNSKNIKHSDDNCYCSDCIRYKFRDDATYGWINSLGHAIINYVYIEIGGQRIDKHYGEWLEIWSELTMTEERKNAYFEMIGKVEPNTFTTNTFINAADLYVPMQFWFCRNHSLALPLISLQYHEVYLVVDFREFNECWVSNGQNNPEKPNFYANLLVDYVFVDLEERQKFISKSHTYLIEQLQICENNEYSGKNNNISFYLSHPVKEILWIFQRLDINTTKDWFNFGPDLDRTNNTITDLFDVANIQINGIDRIRLMPAKYYRLINAYKYHTRVPNNYIYLYPFSLYPENTEPSGTLNFSKINDARLVINTTNKNISYKIKIYAINYNILIITSGMGSTLFAT